LNIGFYQGLDQDPRANPDIQLIPEFAGSGSMTEVVGAAKKLLQFHNVDILSGMINYRVLPEITPLISSRKSLGFFYDMGELLPPNESFVNDIFFNSLQLYQSQYALGYWAQKEFRNHGQIIMPIYNAGFDLHVAFQAGIAAAGGSTVSLSTIHYKQDDPHHLDIEALMEEIKKESPAFVHAIFVGPQGNEFLESWKAQSWTKNIPLLLAENMLYEDMLNDVKHMDLELYGAISWNPSSEQKHNQEFVKKFKENTGQSASIYSLLGYEAGLLFKENLPALKKRDWEVLKEGIQKTVIEGPRGSRKFSFGQGIIAPEIDIVKISCRNSNIHNLILERGETVSQENGVLNPFDDGVDSGWVNPYLCI
jgi:branched-chain amino acid transport system substrate-binding protein